MKRPIILLILISLSVTLFSQKLYTEYRFNFENGDSAIIAYDLLPRKKLNELMKLTHNDGFDNNIKQISDSENRIFELLIYNKETIIVEKIVNGYYRLYAGIDQNYYLKDDSTIYLLEKVIKEKNDYIKETNKYKGILIYLTNNSIEFRDRINKLELKEKELKDLIYDINTNQQFDNNYKSLVFLTKKFILFSLNTGYIRYNYKSSEFKYLGFHVYKLFYYPSFSNSISLNTGLSATYLYREYNSKIIKSAYFGIPFSVNIENTNKTITPYFNIGCFPSVYLEETNSDYGIGLNFSFGLKAKINDWFNVRLGPKSDISGLYFDLGLEFINAR